MLSSGVCCSKFDFPTWTRWCLPLGFPHAYRQVTKLLERRPLLKPLKPLTPKLLAPCFQPCTGQPHIKHSQPYRAGYTCRLVSCSGHQPFPVTIKGTITFVFLKTTWKTLSPPSLVLSLCLCFILEGRKRGPLDGTVPHLQFIFQNLNGVFASVIVVTWR